MKHLFPDKAARQSLRRLAELEALFRARAAMGKRYDALRPDMDPPPSMRLNLGRRIAAHAVQKLSLRECTALFGQRKRRPPRIDL